MEIKGLFQNPRFVTALIIISLLTIILVVCNVLVLGGDGFYNLLNTLVSPLIALIACYLFYKAWETKRDAASQSLWAAMAWGFGLWGLADSIWAFYALVLQQETPYPSIADLVWIIGYIPLFYALITRLRTLKVTPTRRQQYLIYGLNSILIVIILTFIVMPIFQNFTADRALEGIISLIYPLGDLGLVILTSLILILLREGRYSVIWRLIFTGIFIMTVSDLLFVYSTWREIYFPDSHVNAITILVDTTYNLAYIFIALGIYIYRFIWNFDDTFVLNIEKLPAVKYYAFAGTDQEGRLILISDNFFCLVNGDPKANYYKRQLSEVLGVRPGDWRELVNQIKNEAVLRNEPFYIWPSVQKKRKVWITAMANYDPSREFNGINFAFSADMPVREDLRMPQAKELLPMLNYLLSLAGSPPQEEIQAIRAYSQEMIRLFSSLLYQFGGTQLNNALFEALQQTVKQYALQVKIDGQSMNIPEVEEGNDLASSVLPLLKSARDFTVDLVGRQIVDDEIKELEKQLTPTVQRDLDKYQLRSFHALEPVSTVSVAPAS